MGSRGPLPKPDRSSLHGNRDKRSPKVTPKPQPIAVDQPPPANFSSEAADEWRKALAACGSMRSLTSADLALLEQWSIARADFIRATRELEAGGMVITDSEGNAKRSPWLSVRDRASDMIIRLAKEFGFSPAARLRLGHPIQSEGKHVPAKSEGEFDIDDFIRRDAELHEPVGSA